MTGAKPGWFITLEGGEGAGKSTHARRLAAALESRGIATVATREPGGSPGAEDIRKLLVEGEPGRWEPLVETLLMFAARTDHVTHTIIPALARGGCVICDRFTDSTYAYQGAGRGLPRETIRRIEAIAVPDLKPDLTLILDLPAETGLGRAARRNTGETRLRAFRHWFSRAAARSIPRDRPPSSPALRADRRDFVPRRRRRCDLARGGGSSWIVMY